MTDETEILNSAIYTSQIWLNHNKFIIVIIDHQLPLPKPYSYTLFLKYKSITIQENFNCENDKYFLSKDLRKHLKKSKDGWFSNIVHYTPIFLSWSPLILYAAASHLCNA